MRKTIIIAAVAAFAAMALADSLNCRLIGACPTPGYALMACVQGDYAYVADNDSGLVIINVADPASPAIAGRILTRPKALHVEVIGNYAYVACRDSGLRIIDVSNPAAPVQVGHRDTPYWALNVDVSGSHAYVADFVAGLRVINVANPASPYEVGFNTTPGGATWVRVNGIHAYVANAGSGLYVFNVADPANPVYIGRCSTSVYARGVALADTFAYVADAQGGLHVISIADPALPRRLAVISAGFSAHITAANGLACHTADGRVSILDLADPQSPVANGWYDLTGASAAMSSNNLIFATNGTGLNIIGIGGSGIAERGVAPARPGIRAFPNPARGPVRLTCPTEVASVTVIDPAGRIVQTVRAANGAATVAGLDPGVYIIRPSGSGRAETTRLVVR